MPYIYQETRYELKHLTEPLLDGTIDSAGELNYLITCLCNDYLKQLPKSYQAINYVMGALEGAKLELYRRVVAPYEDLKCKENGDVYTV